MPRFHLLHTVVAPPHPSLNEDNLPKVRALEQKAFAPFLLRLFVLLALSLLAGTLKGAEVRCRGHPCCGIDSFGIDGGCGASTSSAHTFQALSGLLFKPGGALCVSRCSSWPRCSLLDARTDARASGWAAAVCAYDNKAMLFWGGGLMRGKNSPRRQDPHCVQAFWLWGSSLHPATSKEKPPSPGLLSLA